MRHLFPRMKAPSFFVEGQSNRESEKQRSQVVCTRTSNQGIDGLCRCGVDPRVHWQLQTHVHSQKTQSDNGHFHDGKIRPGWWGWGMHALPLLLYQRVPSCIKLWCTLLLRGQIHFPSSTLPLYVLCVCTAVGAHNQHDVLYINKEEMCTVKKG
jgi:hypothetical protein